MKLILFQKKFEASYLAAPSGAGDANYSELLLDQIFIEFIKLMKAYQLASEN